MYIEQIIRFDSKKFNFELLKERVSFCHRLNSPRVHRDIMVRNYHQEYEAAKGIDKYRQFCI